MSATDAVVDGYLDEVFGSAQPGRVMWVPADLIGSERGADLREATRDELRGALGRGGYLVLEQESPTGWSAEWELDVRRLLAECDADSGYDAAVIEADGWDREEAELWARAPVDLTIALDELDRLRGDLARATADRARAQDLARMTDAQLSALEVCVVCHGAGSAGLAFVCPRCRGSGRGAP